MVIEPSSDLAVEFEVVGVAALPVPGGPASRTAERRHRPDARPQSLPRRCRNPCCRTFLIPVSGTLHAGSPVIVGGAISRQGQSGYISSQRGQLLPTEAEGRGPHASQIMKSSAERPWWPTLCRCAPRISSSPTRNATVEINGGYPSVDVLKRAIAWGCTSRDPCPNCGRFCRWRTTRPRRERATRLRNRRWEPAR
jgi:hypothetical protein